MLHFVKLFRVQHLLTKEIGSTFFVYSKNSLFEKINTMETKQDCKDDEFNFQKLDRPGISKTVHEYS